ncbi:hypothetical protein [Saccharospirillum mangrovi]|uniref:hypothetical protein n=1 Tax=Saccharospirillum mangrovi TaxID=2161747 RepID=UPI000D35494B|nr:hypothetical protein [Saccharospirillum mangrovi]
MLFRFQDRLLRVLYPMKPLANHLLWLGVVVFPLCFAFALVRPQTSTTSLFLGFVFGLGLVLFGILVSLTRPEALPNTGVRNRLKRFWEALVFWGWVGCLGTVVSLGLKVFSFAG